MAFGIDPRRAHQDSEKLSEEGPSHCLEKSLRPHCGHLIAEGEAGDRLHGAAGLGLAEWQEVVSLSLGSSGGGERRPPWQRPLVGSPGAN